MTHKEIFDNAKWIEYSGSDAPLFRKIFHAEKSEKAEIVICGLGFFKLFINGKKVSDDLLVPNASCYEKRDLSKLVYPLTDNISYRIYAMKYDISDYLNGGENVLAVMVGNGYYNQKANAAEGEVAFGTPKLCYIIKKNSGNVISDETTLSHKGFITFNNLYYGERHNYSLYPQGFMLEDYNDDGFQKSSVIKPPESSFFIQISPADKVIRTIKPKLLKDEGSTRLYDIGENTVGYAVFKCCEKGKLVKVNYAEEIYNTDPRYGIHFNDGYQEEQFITDGTDREYIPHFTWHGFRYFRVNADVEPVRVDVVHSDCPVTSSFKSDNQNLNWLYEAYIRTQLANMHCGVPSDCPHRERLGYTGDGRLCAETAMMLLDCREFYRKWLYDISDCQCKNSGHIQHTAPLMGGGGGPSGWGGAIVEVPYKFYKMYGDKELLNEFFPKMLSFLDYLESRSENGIVFCEEPDGWCLGDWCAPEPIAIPESFVNTALYVKFMQQTLEISKILNRQNEAEHLKEKIKKSCHSLDVSYYSPWSHSYCGNIQGASALAFKIGLGDKKGIENLVKKYKKLRMYDTGIIATDALTEYLFEIGEAQTAFDLMAGNEEISFATMAKNRATTLWENWSGKDSRNHPMFGAVTKYIFMYLLGIRQTDSGTSYKDVIISPCFVDGLNEASGHITTENGIIGIDYKKSGNTATINAFADKRINAVFKFGEEKIPFSGKKTFTVKIGE